MRETLPKRDILFKTKDVIEIVKGRKIQLRPVPNFKGVHVDVVGGTITVGKPPVDYRPMYKGIYTMLEHALAYFLFDSADVPASASEEYGMAGYEALRKVVGIFESHRVRNLWSRIYPGSAKRFGIYFKLLAQERAKSGGDPDPIDALVRSYLGLPPLEGEEEWHAEATRLLREVEGGTYRSSLLVGLYYFKKYVLPSLPRELPEWPPPTPDTVRPSASAQEYEAVKSIVDRALGEGEAGQEELEPKEGEEGSSGEGGGSVEEGSEERGGRQADEEGAEDREAGGEAEEEGEEEKAEGGSGRGGESAEEEQAPGLEQALGRERLAMEERLEEIEEKLEEIAQRGGGKRVREGQVPGVTGTVIADDVRDSGEVKLVKLFPGYAELRRFFERIRGKIREAPDEDGVVVDQDELIQRRIRKTGEVFVTEEPGRGVAVALAVDCSGSMNEVVQTPWGQTRNVEVAKAAAYTIAKALEPLRGVVDFEVYGWGGGTGRMAIRIQRCRKPADIGGLVANLYGYGWTPTHLAVEYGRYILGGKPHSKKILIVITDGLPEVGGFSTDWLAVRARRAVFSCLRQGIQVFGIMVGRSATCRKYMSVMFPNRHVVVEDFERAGKVLARYLTNLISKTVTVM